jgi:hypothetical protein
MGIDFRAKLDSMTLSTRLVLPDAKNLISTVSPPISSFFSSSSTFKSIPCSVSLCFLWRVFYSPSTSLLFKHLLLVKQITLIVYLFNGLHSLPLLPPSFSPLKSSLKMLYTQIALLAALSTLVSALPEPANKNTGGGTANNAAASNSAGGLV